MFVLQNAPMVTVDGFLAEFEDESSKSVSLMITIFHEKQKRIIMPRRRGH